ncbi:MAG: microviridin/marinostatin family tricyclic proteinase inhibitor [Candidatus Eisenbacteria bacterium]|uniref:Microviridin/marinostatin family tricyclic proteinase inhibitor n=1 Tax=Eiseniibacteriota bacterium TaxID=2212470 RepID=A0A956NF43_UNCEI|nr:microviridin/marinostatin family tricyclic proteinase inhibitor [Candidatus Eisenbacteria bacterium]MCB9466488.1 microviridin/marinostatin family tricyclic proteinase inhibitor [Candidatus Eisenbacteria bacterium]
MEVFRMKPFFARLLEKQEPKKVRTGVKAGWPVVTMKWPSDNDDYIYE